MSEKIERLTLAKAITRGLEDAMEADRTVVMLGEDIGKLGGVYRVTEGLQARFGNRRVMDAPLGESGIIGTSIGMALRGYRPVPEIQFDGFVFPAFNQITSQLAKIHNRTDKQYIVPVTIRIPYGGVIGSVEHHSESPEALFAHTAGLRIVTPSTPHEAYWMTRKAIECPDPVIIFEPKRRYWLKGEVDFSDTSFDPFSAQVVREGTDATIVAYGPLVPVALAAAGAAVGEGRGPAGARLDGLRRALLSGVRDGAERGSHLQRGGRHGTEDVGGEGRRNLAVLRDAHVVGGIEDRAEVHARRHVDEGLVHGLAGCAHDVHRAGLTREVVDLVAGTAGTSAEGVATLDHEAGDDAVEDGAVVEGTGGLLAGRGVDPFALALGQGHEVVDRVGGVVGEQFDSNVAGGGVKNSFHDCNGRIFSWVFPVRHTPHASRWAADHSPL